MVDKNVKNYFLFLIKKHTIFFLKEICLLEILMWNYQKNKKLLELEPSSGILLIANSF